MFGTGNEQFAGTVDEINNDCEHNDHESEAVTKLEPVETILEEDPKAIKMGQSFVREKFIDLLNDKIAQYQDKVAENAPKPPDNRITRVYLDYSFKLLIAEMLLIDESISYRDAFQRAKMEQAKAFQKNEKIVTGFFNAAWEVIRLYASGREVEIMGGTGFSKRDRK